VSTYKKHTGFIRSIVSLVINGAGGSHCISVRGKHTEMRGAVEVGRGVDKRLQVVAGVVGSVVCDPGSHVISCALIQHKFSDLQDSELTP